LTYAEWQRIERTTITTVERQWFGLRKPKQVSRTINDPMNVFVPDTYIYPKPGCCPDDFASKLSEGFDHLHPVTFPHATVLCQARINDDESITLSDIDGRWRPGQEIPTGWFAALFRRTGCDLPAANGILG